MDKKTVSKPEFILSKSSPNSRELANNEAENFSNEALEEETRRSEHERKEDAKNIFHYCNSLLFVVLYAGITLGITILFFHWLSPQQYHFLLPSQIDTIKNLLFSALATNYAKDFYKRNI